MKVHIYFLRTLIMSWYSLSRDIMTLSNSSVIWKSPNRFVKNSKKTVAVCSLGGSLFSTSNCPRRWIERLRRLASSLFNSGRQLTKLRNVKWFSINYDSHKPLISIQMRQSIHTQTFCRQYYCWYHSILQSIFNF